MNEREKLILRLALSYLVSNLNDVIELFDGDDDTIDYNGEVVPTPTEDEIEQLAKTLQ